MAGETVFGAIMMMLCGFGCGVLFFWIGVWASSRKDPMHFWSGSTVDPKTISDIPAYNRANARMWKWYSIPFWLSGIMGVLTFFDSRFASLSMIPIGFACTIGIVLLIGIHRRIQKRYKTQ